MNESALNRQLKWFLGWLARFALMTGVIFILTIILLLFKDRMNTSTVALLYLVPVLINTSLWGLWPGVLTAFIAFLVYNYYFLVPYNTFIVHETQDIVTLIIFLLVAVFISQLVGRAKEGKAAALARENEVTHLYELSLSLAGVNSLEEVAQVLSNKISETLKISYLEISIFAIGNQPTFLLKSSPSKPVGKEPDITLPIETVRESKGTVRVWLQDSPFTPVEDRLLRAFAAQAALALERMTLTQTETKARVLEESDRMKSALLSSVSHEFRTPLATIKASTTSLLSDEVTWDTHSRIDLLSAIDEETDYLNYLVGNLLDMSRIEAGALKPKKQWNILAEIVEGVVSHLSRNLSHFQLIVNIPDDLPLVPVDYTQMEQVFSNLLNNSAKYAPEGSSISLKASLKDKTNLLVEVRNEGPQVNPEHLELIFDKFFRVTAPEKVSGTGLGLSICKGIIEAHQGRIWAENTSEGLAFFFTLPLLMDGNLAPKVFSED